MADSFSQESRSMTTTTNQERDEAMRETDANGLYRESLKLRAGANAATKAADDKFAEAYAADVADGDIGLPIEGALCPMCGAASPRYCELKDTNGGECPAPPTNQEHGEG
jgi:hypothetical protein